MKRTPDELRRVDPPVKTDEEGEEGTAEGSGESQGAI